MALLQEDINSNLDKYTHYYTKCCDDTEDCSPGLRTRQDTFSNEAIRRVMKSGKSGRTLVTRQSSYVSKPVMMQPPPNKAVRAQQLRSSLICTSFGTIKDDNPSQRKRLRLEDILKAPQTPLQPRSINKPKRIEILGFKLGATPSEVFATMPTLPNNTPTARQLQFQDNYRQPSKSGRSFRSKFFAVTL